ncbi:MULTISPECIES: hypothetical protein [unclassified Streptomyces]|uniref:hypothetical protein n=1 Tax=unclassified Streptomyces TaxID=2593676 RepID=UPI00081D8620|nr:MULTISPECIES: hypothetical protein [unclassified Streptomyces]MYR97064.1 hypothetical protein [Streptomyces sp. SID4937]SCE20271.1 hypothetical protein GA0115243_108411 [Streptomyces sp. ScaeMP-e83]
MPAIAPPETDQPEVIESDTDDPTTTEDDQHAELSSDWVYGADQDGAGSDDWLYGAESVTDLVGALLVI